MEAKVLSVEEFLTLLEGGSVIEKKETAGSIVYKLLKDETEVILISTPNENYLIERA